MVDDQGHVTLASIEACLAVRDGLGQVVCHRGGGGRALLALPKVDRDAYVAWEAWLNAWLNTCSLL